MRYLTTMRPLATTLSTALMAVFISLLIPEAQAQIEVTESDVRSALIGDRVAVQEFVATSPSELSPLFDQPGDGATFDFSSTGYRLASSGFRKGWKIENAPQDIPSLDRFADQNANVVLETQLQAQEAAETDSTVWQFLRVGSSEQSLLGFVTIFSRDIDQDGDQPDTVRVDWTPPLIQSKLPLNTDAQWSQRTELSFSVLGLPTTRSNREVEATGFGTLETPFGSARALRLRNEVTDTTVVAGTVTNISQSTSLEFNTKDGRLGASVIRDEDSGEVTSASVDVVADEGEAVSVSQGGTPTISGVSGVEISLTEGSSAPGTLGVSRFDSRPFNNSYSGTATSDDGSSVTPDVVWDGRYFVVQNQGLQDFSAEVCIDISSAPGVGDAGKLVVLTREAADADWSPLDSSLDGNQLCAITTSFSQFAVGGNSSSNALPVELASFEARADGNAARLQWVTASETRSAGFEVQRRTERGFETLGFVEGAGTTTEPTRYTYTAEGLDPGTQVFRLRQVDLDGSATPTGPVAVRIRMQKPVKLTNPAPNPASSSATISFAVKEQAETTIRLFDTLGQKVRAIYEGTPQAGEEQRARVDVSTLPSGVYFLRLSANGQTRTQKLTVVR
jgi:hypothetical protein